MSVESNKAKRTMRTLKVTLKRALDRLYGKCTMKWENACKKLLKQSLGRNDKNPNPKSLPASSPPQDSTAQKLYTAVLNLACFCLINNEH